MAFTYLRSHDTEPSEMMVQLNSMNQHTLTSFYRTKLLLQTFTANTEGSSIITTTTISTTIDNTMETNREHVEQNCNSRSLIQVYPFLGYGRLCVCVCVRVENSPSPNVIIAGNSGLHWARIEFSIKVKAT